MLVPVRLCALPLSWQSLHLTHLRGIFLHVLSGHYRTDSATWCCHQLEAPPTPVYLNSHLPRLPLCFDPQSVAIAHPATPTLASSVFTDGSVKSGWAPKMLLDFCSPLVPRPYGAAGEESGGSATHSCPPQVSCGHLLHGILVLCGEMMGP